LKNAPQIEDTAPLAGSGDAGSSHPEHTRSRDAAAVSAPWRRSAPAGTAQVAGARIGPRAQSLREQVMAFIISRGLDGATDEEGELALGIKPQTYNPRRLELVKLGVVEDTGRRRRMDAGRPAAVWVIVSGRQGSSVA
jgi:hypothetical protein